MSATSIEWTDATWNPTRGCSRVSEGCRNCYAERVAVRSIGGAHKGFVESREGGPRWTGRVELVLDRLDQPARWRKPRRIFVNSLSDLFHERLDRPAIDAVLMAMAMAPQHTYQVLTKRPDRMHAYFTQDIEMGRFVEAMTLLPPGLAQRAVPNGTWITEGRWRLPNLWLGVSVEDQDTADGRIPVLLQTPAAIHFVSAEPLLGEINLRSFGAGDQAVDGDGRHLPKPDGRPSRVDWVIVGGESGPRARQCHVNWIREIVRHCRSTGVPVFVKQLGSAPVDVVYLGSQGMVGPSSAPWPKRTDYNPIDGQLILNDSKGSDPSEWPVSLVVREFPRAAEDYNYRVARRDYDEFHQALSIRKAQSQGMS